MLVESPSPVNKRIGILAHSEGLRALLQGLLRQWHYTLIEAPTADDLLLVEEGCRPPEKTPDVIWLTSSRYEGFSRLPLPVPVEELWSRVESRFHRPPRNHLRIAVRIPVVVHARGESIPAQVGSLSDLGVRIDFPREMVSGEELVLEMALDGEPLSWRGRVIYVIPRGDPQGSEKWEIGVIFDRLPGEYSRGVREHIIWLLLENIRRELPEPLFREGLGFFRIPEAVLQRLTEPASGNP